jgi:hypothetical protein
MADLITDIVEQEIVNKLDNLLKVIRASAVVNDVQTLEFCDIKWLELYNEFTNGLQVVSVSGNSVDVATSTPITVGTILEIQRPLFLDGTPLNTVQEWHEFNPNEKEKLPFIWLVTAVDDGYQNRTSAIERIVNCQIFFVHWSNWLELNQNRVNDTIRPLHKVIDAFANKVNNNPPVFDRLSNNGTRREYPKFGRETNEGIEEVIMNSTLGAIRYNVELRIKRNYICEC